MIPNPKKFQAPVSSKNNSLSTIGVPFKIKNQVIHSKGSVVFLGINLENRLKFDEHIDILCKKAASKMNSLYRIKDFLNYEMKRLLVNSFIYSNFNYCPQVWHISSPKSIQMIEKIQE